MSENLSIIRRFLIKILTKATNLGVLMLCLLVYLIRGNTKKVRNNPKTIVILRSKPNIGDAVYITPMFRAIKATYPSCRIVVISGGRVEEVLRYNPDINEYINYDNNLWGTVRKLRREKIDFACLANLGSSIGFALLYLGGAKVISVLSSADGSGDASFSYSILKKLAITTPFYSGTYVPEQYLKLLRPINANISDTHFRLYFSGEAKKTISEMFRGRGIDEHKDFIVGIAPGGAVEKRWWPANRFAKLADHLVKYHNAKVFLVGVGKDQKAIQRVIDNLDKNTHCVSLLNQSLDGFKAFISQCKLVIGNDSGPMVTADAFDVANLVFVGPTDEREYHRPPGPLNRIAKSLSGEITDISLELAMDELSIILNNLHVENE